MPSRRELANAIRILSMDAVQQAESGHPGMPMGMADIAEVLWRDFVAHNPGDPRWHNRDRVVLSNGHGSMLLYSVLHLTGYALTIDDLKQFRQLHSKTPGHPEYGYTPGVETTTGPLGQGLSNAVGMAIAEKLLAQRFNREGYQVVDHHTYVLLGDGCLMEGISHEACSLAGTLKLGKLIAIYDDNGISIDGHVDGWFTDDTPKRFAAYGWHVVPNVDGHDAEAVRAAIAQAKAVTDKPSLICAKTVIGWGAPNLKDSHACHGAPLGKDEIAASRRELSWPHEPFVIPAEIYAAWNACDAGAQRQKAWQELFTAYARDYPTEAIEFTRRMRGDLPGQWDETIRAFIQDTAAKAPKIASRKASGNTIQAIAPILPEFLGGSADLTGSNLTNWSGTKLIAGDDSTGNYISYGVREFGMSGIMNGIALHGGFIPYAGTFLVFSDYARNAVRLAALMKQRVIHVYTHDSIGLGEDGPTHQPIEHCASLRYIPNLYLWRPADAVETAVAWQDALERKQAPTCLVLSRQNLPPNSRSDAQLANVRKGGYVLREAQGTPQLVLIATGSEVELAVQAAQHLEAQHIPTRVVSMPCTLIFDQQESAYRASVLPSGVPRVAIEAGVRDFWWKYVGPDGDVVGMDRFGESAPANKLFAHFGFSVENVVAVARRVIK
jgi:transketolase